MHGMGLRRQLLVLSTLMMGKQGALLVPPAFHHLMHAVADNMVKGMRMGGWVG